MKEFSCCKGHQFDACEVKEWIFGISVCPECWPDGFKQEDLDDSQKEIYQELKASFEQPKICEFGCSSRIGFLTKEGVHVMEPGKRYDENLNEIKD